MGGSFESGAGDDPDELFASDDEDEEESESEDMIEAESEQEPHPETTGTTTTDTGDQEQRGSSSGTATSTTADTGEHQRESSVMVEFDSREEIDAARLAREFVPDTYDKPHAWALGRDGVNDGRSEKKTFFLQSSVLDLEAVCSQEVNEMLNGDVPLTDLRELALIIAYHQPELLAEAAQEWGAESA